MTENDNWEKNTDDLSNKVFVVSNLAAEETGELNCRNWNFLHAMMLDDWLLVACLLIIFRMVQSDCGV